MAKIALHDYLNEIEQLLEVEQTSDVIDHCRHILRQYPRHVDTYRTLAKALLEQRDFDDAAELFQRILSTDPNDFVAHVGLSAVFREKQEYTESVWHLERAFEMDPYNAALQEELKELYELRDEQRPRRVPLTRASLARLYVKGELYQQAASELSQILAENGTDRVDLEILLAEALWRDGQRVDAVDISLKVLEKLPNSVTINAILGEIWLLTGRTEEAQEYLQRLLALTQVDQSHLDPDSVIGHAFNTEGAPKLPNVVSVERKGEGTSDLPDWGGDKIADKTVTDDEAVYDWLRDAGVVEEILADEEDDVFDTSADWFTDQTDVQSDEQEAMARAADWLDDLGVVSETGDSDFGFGFTEEFASETSMEQPEDLLAQDDSLGWLTDSGAGAGADAEIPDWMEDFAENRPDVVADDDEMTTDWFRVGDDDAVDTVADESGTDWFKTEDEPTSDEGTDWLTEDDSEDAPTVSVPNWLAGTNIEEEDASEAELVAFDTDELMSSTEGDEPDWLMGDTDAFVGETADSTEDVSFTDQLWADEADQDEFGVDWLGAANTIDLSQIEGTLPVDNADAEDDVDGLDWLIESETEGIKTADSVDLADLIDSERFGTDPLLSGASAEVADWLMGGDSEQFGDEDQLSFEDAQVFDTSELLGDADDDAPDWLFGGSSEPEPEIVDDFLAGDDEAESDEWMIDEERAESSQYDNMQIFGTAELLGDVGDGETPDWLLGSNSSDDEPEAEELTTGELLASVSDTSVEDWLADIGNITGEDEDELEEDDRIQIFGTAELLGDAHEDGPDWLFGGSSEPEFEEPTTGDLLASANDDEIAEDWLGDFGEIADDDEALEVDDNIQIFGTAELLGDAHEDGPDWLFGGSSESELEEPTTGDLLAGSAENWLGDFEETADDAVDNTAVEANEAATESDRGILSWLSDEVPTAQNEADEVADIDETITGWLLDDDDPQSEDDQAGEALEGPDWLFSDEAESQDEMEALVMADNEKDKNQQQTPDDGDSNLDWLNDLTSQGDDDTDSGLLDEEFGTGELPDWLNDLTTPASESETEFVETAESNVPLNLTNTDLPDWLTKEVAEAGEKIEADPDVTGSLENLPEWLRPPDGMDLGSPASSGMSANVDDSLDNLDWLQMEDADAVEDTWADLDEDDEPPAEIVNVQDLSSDDAEDMDDASSVWLAALAGQEDEADLSFLDSVVAEEPETAADDFDLALESDDDMSFLNELLGEEETAVPMAEPDYLDFGKAETAEDLPSLTDLFGESEDEAATSVAGLDDLDFGEEDTVDDASFLDDLFGTDDEETADDLPSLTDLFGESEDGAATSVAGLDDLDFGEEDTVDGASFLDDLFGTDEEETAEDLPSLTDLFGESEDEADTPVAGLDDLDFGGEDMADDATFLDNLFGTDEEETADDLPSLTDLFGESEDEADTPVAGLDDLDFGDEETVDDAAFLDDLFGEADDEDIMPVAELDDLDFGESETADDVAVLDTEEALFAFEDADDLDDPMAWLEQLAVEQDDPVEELPSVLDTSMYELNEMRALVEPEDEEDTAVDLEVLPDDPEEAVAWLEELAADQEHEDDFLAMIDEGPAGVELPAIDDLIVDELPDDPDAAVAWLEQLATDDEPEEEDFLVMTEAMALDDTGELEESILAMDDEIPDDPDAAVAWLEQLAADSDEFEEEESSMVAEVIGFEDEAEEMDLETADFLGIDDEAVAWLDELAAEQDDDSDEIIEIPELEEMDGDFGTELDDLVDDEDELEAIAWLDELVEEEEPVAESVTKVEAAPEPPDPLQTVLSQLAQLAAQDAVSLDEIEVDETAVATEDDSLDNILDWLENKIKPQEASIEDETDNELELGEDLFVPAVEEESEEDAATVFDSLSDDMSDEDVMAFMDGLLGEDATFVPEKDVSFNPEFDMDAKPSFAASEAVAEADEEEETAVEPETITAIEQPEDDEDDDGGLDSLFDNFSDDMSDDDIMAFMDGLLGEDATFVPEKDVSFNPEFDMDAKPSFAASEVVEEEVETAVEVEAVPSPEPEEDVDDELGSIFDNLSDDMSDDDIMAFMDDLLGEDATFVPEKDVSFNPEFDMDATPSYVTAKSTSSPVEEPGTDMSPPELGELPDDPDDAVAWLEDLAATQEDVDEDEWREDRRTLGLTGLLPSLDDSALPEDLLDNTLEGATAVDSSLEFDETLSDSLPDWLGFEEEERMPGHTDWLRSLPEPDVAGWLEAEQEAMASGIFEDITTREFNVDASIFEEDATFLEAEEEPFEDDFLEERIATGGLFSIDENVLDSARQALAKQDYKSALSNYRQLVHAGQGLSTLIAELETAADEHKKPSLRHLLGDAYMRNGQLNRALETYREALDGL